MIGRQIVGGVVGLGAMSIFAAGLVWSGNAPRPPTAEIPIATLVERLNAARPPDRRWDVVHALTFRRVMVVDVETQHAEDARAVAAVIVTPAQMKANDEILIYFRNTPDRKGPAERRVQWTPQAGFTELTLR
jgi:hypothetical protein